MKKRAFSYVLVVLLTLIVSEIYHPLAGVTLFAQGTCQSFPETNKVVCGKFLAYWQQHGGLAQQGYPISSEFVEVSELNGNAYTVQYFERAVFEYHPEFAGTTNEVLLSQLGTFAYDRRYKGATPVPQPTSVIIEQPTRPPAPTASTEHVYYSGSPSTDTQTYGPFTLAGGRYIGDWTAEDSGSTSVGCYEGITLRSTDPNYFFAETIVGKLIDGGTRTSGSVNLPSAKAGPYQIVVNSGCYWSVSIHK